MRRSRSLFTVAAFALLLAAPGVPVAAAQTPAPTEPPGTPGEIVLVGDVGVSLRAGSGPMPDGCRAPELVQLIEGYLSAFNQGDTERLLRYFPREADQTVDGAFHWYAVSGPPGSFNPGFQANTREELVPYLVDRQAHGERMQLRQLDYGTDRDWADGDRGIDFTLDVLRSADDLPTHEAGVKGAIDCHEQTIYVWSMGDRGVVPDSWFATPAATPAPQASAGTETACPVTAPNGAPAAGAGPIENAYGNDALWTRLWPDGQVVFESGGPGFVLPDGALGMKWGWEPLVPGELSIEGQRLDQTAPPLRADIGEGFYPGGYGPEGRFFPAYLIFPTPGCWEVTGHIDDASLTFVIEVVLVGDGPDWRPDSVP